MLIGVLLGWGIGAAGMKAAVAARDKVLLESSLQRANETYVLFSFYIVTALSPHSKRCWFCKSGPSVQIGDIPRGLS
jgi:hypothetical protein